MPDPLSHHPAMLIIKPDSLPRLWWLFPWSVCRQLHKNAVALRELADKEAAYGNAMRALADKQSTSNMALKAEVTRLAYSRDHWLAKHDRAYAVAMHNERVIAEMEARSR